MKVLVTGDRGYIGEVMVKYLSGRGHEVAGLDTDYYADGDFTSPCGGFPRLRKDIRDVNADDLKGFDAIIHLAALSNDPVGDLREEWTYEINYGASARLAELAKQAGVRRFLYSSSCSMYGAAGDVMLSEDAPLHPLTAYAKSKVRSEKALAKLADKDFSPTFMRNATVYGVSPRLRVDIVLNNLVGWAVTTGKIRILSDGTPWRPIIHVEDVAQAFALVLEAPLPLVHNQAYNVGSDAQNFCVRDIAQAVGRAASNCEIQFAGETGPDPRNYRVDFTKLARAFPQYRPRWDVDLGAQELYDAYREAGMTLGDFQGRKYTRLKQLRYLLDTARLDGTLRWVGPTH